MMRTFILTLVLFLPGARELVSAGEDRCVIVSLLGDTLRTIPLPAEILADRLAKLADAEAACQAAPDDPDALIWLGRRTAYLGRYCEAIEIFFRGIERFPEDARFYRHRGHRFLTVREFSNAERDLAKAAELTKGKDDEVEPDGLPNTRNIPTGTLQSNIFYHLGLARYLQGDFAGAANAYAECMKVSGNDDMLVATSHWFYMTLRRLGRVEEAEGLLKPVHEGMEIIENDGYYKLLLLYKGVLNESALARDPADGIQSATTSYGVANWYHYHGEKEVADSLFREILAGAEWAAFGYIAAEAEVAGKR